MQLVSIIAWLVVVAALVPSSSRACSCVARSPAEYFEAADVVFVGVARERTLEVLQGLKGRPGARIALPELAPCSPQYQPGEVAIVFMKDKQLSLCDGNFALTHLLAQPGLAEMLEATSAPALAPSRAAFGAAFEATLTPYLAARPRVRVRGLPAGEGALRVAGSDFVSSADGVVDVIVEHALRRGGLAFIAGTVPADGVHFAVLVADREASALVYGHAVDPAVARPYRCARDADCTATCATGAVNASWFAKHHRELASCEDGCTSKGFEAPRCVGGACTAFRAGQRVDACSRKPIAWQR